MVRAKALERKSDFSLKVPSKFNIVRICPIKRRYPEYNPHNIIPSKRGPQVYQVRSFITFHINF